MATLTKQSVHWYMILYLPPILQYYIYAICDHNQHIIGMRYGISLQNEKWNYNPSICCSICEAIMRKDVPLASHLLEKNVKLLKRYQLNKLLQYAVDMGDVSSARVRHQSHMTMFLFLVIAIFSHTHQIGKLHFYRSYIDIYNFNCRLCYNMVPIPTREGIQRSFMGMPGSSKGKWCWLL